MLENAHAIALGRALEEGNLLVPAARVRQAKRKRGVGPELVVVARGAHLAVREHHRGRALGT